MIHSTPFTCKNLTAWVCLTPLTMFLVILFGFGCSKASEKITLVDYLKTMNGIQIAAIEQLDLTTRGGLLSSEALRTAKIIKRVQDQVHINTFVNAISTATEGHRFANHPVDIGEIVLRVETTNGSWFMFCHIMIADNTKTCSMNVGEDGETNINRMKVYESTLGSVNK